MAFQIKDFASIVASMINVMRASTRRVTDFNVGSAVRSMLEAVGIEMDQLYQEMFHGIKEAIPVSTYTTFEYGLLPASAATGLLTFFADNSNTEDVLIPTGTLAKNPTTNKLYRTTRDGLLEVGATEISVAAIAVETGEDSNCDANTILQLVDSINGIIGVSNPVAFRGGADLESDESRKLRFQAFISTLNRGTTSALKYGASTAVVSDINGLITERVAHVGIIEPYEEDPVLNNPGFVQVYVHNGIGGTSTALVNEVQKVIDGYYLEDGTPVAGWKSAGVKVNCYAASEVVVPVTGVLTILPGYQVDAILDEAETAITDYILALGIGDDVVTAEIVQRVMDIPGLYNFVASLPATAVVDITKAQKAMPGVVTLTT